MTAPIPHFKHHCYGLRNQNVFEPINTRTNSYYHSYYPFCIREWNKLDSSLRSIASLANFKSELIKSIRPPKRSLFNISDIVGIRLLTRLRLGFSHLREHKFRHNFNTNNSKCAFGDGDETTEHYLLRCQKFNIVRSILFDKLSDILNIDVKLLPEHRLVNILLYGDNTYNEIANRLILEATISFIKLSKRFDT